MAEQDVDLAAPVEGRDGLWWVRAGENCRGWNGIHYRVGLSANPVIGTTDLRIQLTQAAPNALAFLVAEPSLLPGTTPGTVVASGCGIVVFGPAYLQFHTFTNVLGRAELAGGLPSEPALVGLEFVLQWGILDGGPLLGALSVSDAMVLRIGEL